MRALIYRRQSQDKGRTELAVERQGVECQRLCDVRGWTVTDTITDNDVSASKHGRKGYAQVIELMERKAVDVVVILRIDRLLRLNDELEQLIQLSEDTGVIVATVEGDVDLTTPQGRLIARILVSVARNEVEVKAARQKLANQQHAALGKPYSSVRPYGYERGYTAIREDEATVLRQMADMVLKGYRYRDVVYWLNQNGHKTATGGLWVAPSVRRVLSRKAYAGIREYNGAEYPGTWDPIFDPDTWERLQLTVKATSEKYAGSVSRGRKYLLTGFVFCGLCGTRMTGTGRYNNRLGDRHQAYHCRKRGDFFPAGGCGSISRGAAALDHYVTSLVFERLDSPYLAKLLSNGQDDTQLSELLTQRQTQKVRLDGLTDDYATGLLDKAQFARAKQTAEAELSRLDTDIAALTAHTSVRLDVGETLASAWETRPLSWKQQLLGLVIKQIKIMPTRKATGWYVAGDKRFRFNPSSVVVEWQDGLTT